MKISSWLAVMLLIALTACTQRIVKRTDYTLDKFEDLLFSDSPTLALEPTSESSNTIRVTEGFLLENRSSATTYSLDLRTASFDVRGQKLKPECNTLKGTNHDQVDLEPGAIAKVLCKVIVASNADNKLAMKDTTSILTIPVKGKSASVLTFKYLISAEDFE